ncbi:MAG TPA: ribokinase [Bacillota bacterium]
MIPVAGGKARILVVGSLNMDLVLKTARLPQPGESLFGSEHLMVPGGKGANQAVAAARLGGATTLIGRVGEDPDGRRLRDSLRQEGVDDRFVSADPSRQTGLGVVILEDTGENRIIVYPGANLGVTVDDLAPAFAEPWDAVITQLEVPGLVVVETCRLGRAKGFPAILDAGPAQPFPLEELGGLEILTPNETEALALTGIDTAERGGVERAAEVLQRRSQARFIVIKLGVRGAFLYGDGLAEPFPANPVRVVDPTAAGDAFTAELTLQYVAHGDIRRAVHYAGLAGALAVTRLGAQPSLPGADEMREFARGRGLEW